MALLGTDLVVRMVAQLLLERMAFVVVWYDSLVFNQYTPLRASVGNSHNTHVIRFKAKQLGGDYAVRFGSNPDEVVDVARLMCAERARRYWDIGAMLCGAVDGLAVLPAVGGAGLADGAATLTDACMARQQNINDLRWTDALRDAIEVRPDTGDPLWGVFEPGLHGPGLDLWRRCGRMRTSLDAIPAWLAMDPAVPPHLDGMPADMRAIDVDAFERTWDAGVADLASLVALPVERTDCGGPLDRMCGLSGEMFDHVAWLTSLARYPGSRSDRRSMLSDVTFDRAGWRRMSTNNDIRVDGLNVAAIGAVGASFLTMLANTSVGTGLSDDARDALSLTRERVRDADGLVIERIDVTMALGAARLSSSHVWSNGRRPADVLAPLHFTVYVGFTREVMF